MAR
ncbi:pilV domain protein, partial [Escherichia coli TW09098]|jgi:hypothetical protein